MITRYMIMKLDWRGARRVLKAEPLQPWGAGRVHAANVASAVCSTGTVHSVAEYLDRTQAWRPLDLHPDWRPWPGATTKGNTK